MPGQSSSPPFDYSPHGLRLNGRDWLIVIALVLAFAFLAPRLLSSAEHFSPGPDYRLPYALSDDYWHYQRHLQVALEDSAAVVVIGDSVVWGEYVAPDGSLSHFLRTESATDREFVNAGLNGLFPLALEGLLRDFGHPIRDRKVLLHANFLWMTSPEADLSAPKEQKFNHEALVPQFSIDIPCYDAPIDRRLSHLADRKVPFFAWTKHLQICFFDQMSIPAWTLADGNAYRNPLAQLARDLPAEPSPDPDRGETSPRHAPWSENGRKPQSFEWVSPEHSLQFAAIQRLSTLLKSRHNDLLVVVGPLNEHMIAEGNRAPHQALKSALTTWLDEQGIPHLTPATLPSDLYGDASHPLTTGYRLLARQLLNSSEFSSWLK